MPEMMEDRIIKTTTRGDGEVLVRTMSQSCCSPFITYMSWPHRRYDDWPVKFASVGSFTKEDALKHHDVMVEMLDADLADMAAGMTRATA